MRLTDEQIGAELHALRETPRERFAAELDQRVAEGFSPRGGESAAPGWRDRLAPLLRPRFALAAAATLLLALTVSVAVTGSLDDDMAGVESGGDSGEVSAPQIDRGLESKPLGGADTDGAAEPAPSRAAEPAPQDGDAGSLPFTDQSPSNVPPVPPGERLKPGRQQIQERSASMTLSTDPDQVADVSDGVVEVTERHEGIVVTSNVETGTDKGRATFDLQIPTASLGRALSDLSDLADVVARNEGSLNITSPFVTAEERFGDAKAEVDVLLDQLADADSASEVASVRQQLRIARGELASARAELATLKQRAGFSRVSITVISGEGDGDWSIGDAADDAVGVLEALGGAALVTLAVLIPLGGIAVLIWLGVRQLRRRSRERALERS